MRGATTPTGAADRVRGQAADAVQQSGPWIERMARVGYAAKGVVYLIIGVLAAQAAFGSGGETTDTQGALDRIGAGPAGQALLWIVALGLVGYAAWRAVAAVKNPDAVGEDGAKALAKRASNAFKAIVHLALAWQAARLAMGGQARKGGGSAQQDWTARLLEAPAGKWLVAAVGVGVMAYGLYQLYRAYKAKFVRKLSLPPGEVGTWGRRFGQFGIAARGVVFFLIGTFVLRAGMNYDPNQVRGISGALDELASQPYGPWLMGTVALGLAAYGLYELFEAKYRRISAG